MDDQTNGVKEEEVKLPEESPTTNQTTEDVNELEAEAATEEQGTETETAESNKGANQRIRELVRENKELKAKSLAEKLAEVTDPLGSQEHAPFKPQVEPGQEITTEQYSQDVNKTAAAIVQLEIKQNNAINRIQNESEAVVRKYPQLDPENENFDKELSEAVTEATEAHVRSAPYSASVSKFVDKLMKPYLGSVAKEVEKVTVNVAKQVTETALKPTSVRRGEKSASEKSIAELEAELGVIQA